MTDREACALLAEALSDHMQPDEYAVIMSRSKRDSKIEPGAPDLRERYPATEWTRLYGAQPAEDEAEEDEDTNGGEEFLSKTDRGAIKDFIRRLKDPDDAMKLLIVNSMLLTGFDAPPIQAIFLDRGLRDHTLMQAIARTNRRYRNKSFGLVLDYWGVFDDLKEALKEFATDDLDGLVEDTGNLIARFPQILDDALAIVEEAPGSGRKRMLWVVRRFNDHPEDAQRFRDLVQEAQDAWETVSPDPRLLAYRPRYQEVLEVWLAWRRGMRSSLRPGTTGLGRKTEQLVQEAIGFERMRDELPAHEIDAEFLERLKDDEELTPGEKATDIEGALVHEAKARGADDPRAKALLERLADLRRRQQKNAQMTMDGLKEWEELVSDFVAQEEEVENLGLDEAGALTFQSLRGASPSVPEEQLLDVSRAMSEHFRETAGFAGWSERDDVVQGLRRAVISELVKHADTRRLAAEPQVVDDLLAALTTIERGQSS
jgi:type I restriction enzyme R subunit